MAFQIKDFVSIAASMVNWMRNSTQKITDFSVGGVARTLVEAAAIELDEFYQRMFIGLKEAIPVSVYNSFDFNALPALAAGGLVRVSIASQTSDVLIGSGTVFKAAGKTNTYTSTQDVTITAGNTYADVPVVCATPGVVGNLAAATACTLAPSPVGFVSASNLASFLGGVDAEDDDGRKLRFQSFITSLARGTNAAVDYGLRTVFLTDAVGNETERVVYVAVVEPWLTDGTQPVSLVNCYVHNGVGATSSALLAHARDVVYGYTDASGNKIPGWKAAGVNVQVYAATEDAVAITATLTALAGYDQPTLVSAAQAALEDYLLTLPIGASAIRAKIVEVVMDIEGVYNFVPTVPAGDTAVASNVKIMPGVIAIT